MVGTALIPWCAISASSETGTQLVRLWWISSKAFHQETDFHVCLVARVVKKTCQKASYYSMQGADPGKVKERSSVGDLAPGDPFNYLLPSDSTLPCCHLVWVVLTKRWYVDLTLNRKRHDVRLDIESNDMILIQFELFHYRIESHPIPFHRYT